MKSETIAVYVALVIAIVFVAVATYATLKAGSDEDDRMEWDDHEE